MDCFFLEGTEILFRVGLSLFKLNRDALLKCKHAEEVLCLMKNINNNFSVSQIVEVYSNEK
jgi:hypothetical protein